MAADTGLSVSFSRNIATIDPTGVLCDATTSDISKARYDRPFRLSPVSVPEQVYAESVGIILASGVDANGEDPLMVYIRPDAAKLWVFVDDDPGNVNETSLTVKILDTAVATNYSNVNRSCLPFTTEPDETWLQPVTATVFHGAIILAGPVLTETMTSDRWTFGAWGFMISQDAGLTWTSLWSDLADPKQVNLGRGWVWCLKSCPAHNHNAHPLEFWVCCTDYRAQGSIMPDGGRVYVARMVRDDTSSDWGIDHGSPVFKTFDLPIASTDPITGCHAHSCYLVEYGEVGDENKPVQLVVSLGDGQFNNRIARFIWDNDEGDHGDFTDNWVEADDFHGRRTTGTDPVDMGSLNFQPVGVAGMLDIQQVGEDYFYKPSLIWGVDVSSEWINQFVLPLPEADPDQATVRHLWGWDTGYGSARSGYLKYPYSLMATINESAPEILGPLVATVYDTTDQNGPTPARVLYNAGIADRPLTAWHQVASVFGGNVTSAVRFNDSIWFSQWGETGAGLYKVGIPTDETDFEPIIVSPGGTNLVHEEYALTEVAGTQLTDLTPVARETSGVPGLFEDPDSLAVLPPCPTMAKQAWRIETDRNVPGSTAKHYITDVYVSSNDPDFWNTLDSGSQWEQQLRTRRYRAWVLDNSYDNTGTVDPNKSLQMSTTILNLNTVDPDVFPNKPGPIKYSSSDRWCPVTFIAYHDFTSPGPTDPGDALAVRLRAVWSGEADWPDDNNFYFVVDSALDGFGSLPYPIAHTDETAVTGPDERLTVTTGFGGPNLAIDPAAEWSIRVAGMLPEGDWDQYAKRVADDEEEPDDRRYWPLFTLWINDTNYFEFQANCVDQGFRIKAVIANVVTNHDFGNGTQIWLPDSQFYAVISFKKTNDGSTNEMRLFAGASLGGGPVAVLGTPITSSVWPDSAVTQLRFRAGPKDALEECVRANEVVTMRWFGGEFLTGAGAAFVDDADVKAAFEDPDLAWLKGPE